MPTVLALRHVEFEDLDGFGRCFEDLGFNIRYHDMWYDESPIDPIEPDVLVVLGAPVGVYDENSYEFIRAELKLVEARLAAELPILGICFGAQVLARALGARVFQGNTFEYGWSSIHLASLDEASIVKPFASNPGYVFQSHGDTFDLPEGAARILTSNTYENQAFAYKNSIGLPIPWRSFAERPSTLVYCACSPNS